METPETFENLIKTINKESIENHLQLSWFGRTAASNSHFTVS